MFLHDAILEGITSGNTEVPVDRLAQRMNELEQADTDGETGFQKEFNVRKFLLSLILCSRSLLSSPSQRLRQFRVNIREFTDANDDANKFKNRLANALPCKASPHPPWDASNLHSSSSFQSTTTEFTSGCPQVLEVPISSMPVSLT